MTEAARLPAPGMNPAIGKLRHPTRWLTAVVLLLLAAMLTHALISNQRFQWSVVWQYFVSHQILAGLERTIYLTVVAMAIGVVLGTILAVMKMAANPIANIVASLYIWFFRGTPLLVQLIFWYNLSALYPKFSFGIPFGTSYAHVTTNSVLSVTLAAIIGLGLNESAYTAEIIRAGLISVDQGQSVAGLALGMRETTVFRRIVWPQALRVIVPPMSNQVIGMLKFTSLVSVIALPELLYSAQLIYQQNFQTIPLLMVACIWYLVLTSILTVAQTYVERHYGKGQRASQTSGLSELARMVRGLWDTAKGTPSAVPPPENV